MIVHATVCKIFQKLLITGSYINNYVNWPNKFGVYVTAPLPICLRSKSNALLVCDISFYGMLLNPMLTSIQIKA